MIHLELGLRGPGDNAQYNPHTRAADYLHAWQEERVWIRETEPVIYYYTLSFSLAPDVRQTRHGFIYALRLEDFRSGCVRPHEKTFRAVKEERLQLMLACHADLSPIFALYDDPARVIDHHLHEGRETEPSMAFLDAQGMEHRVWRVSDPKVLRQVRALMLDKPIFIADGHHRYETALPVLLKRGLSSTIKEWLMSAEYIMSRGNHQVILCERGIRTFETATRNTFDLSAVPLLKQLTHLPVVVDPSHGVGKWDLVGPMSKAAVASGADGLLIEVLIRTPRRRCRTASSPSVRTPSGSSWKSSNPSLQQSEGRSKRCNVL